MLSERKGAIVLTGSRAFLCLLVSFNQEKIKTDEDAENFVEFVEGVATKINGLDGFVEAMRGAIARVSVALARYELQNQSEAS